MPGHPADPIDLLSTGIAPPDGEVGVCMICQEDMSSGATHMLECGHRFHTTCVVAWFRSGRPSCPYCSDTGVSYSPNGRRRHRDYGIFAKMPNFRFMISYSRRKDAPDSLVKMVRELRAGEEALAAKKKESAEFSASAHTDMSFSEAASRHRRLRRAYWKQFSAVGRTKRMIDGYPIVPMVIPRFVSVQPTEYPSHS